MFNVRSLARTALFAGALAAASMVTATAAHAAPPPLQFSANIHCNSLTDVVTVFNNADTDVVATVDFQTSLQSSSKSGTVPAHSSIDLVFNLTVGERLDKVILRDSNLAAVFTAFLDKVVTGSGGCTRPAFDLVELTGYSLTCNAGTTHATVTVKNSGDYGHDVTASADAWFATDSEYQAALQAGSISDDSQTVALTIGSTRVIELDFEVVDAFVLSVTTGQSSVFTDGPRSPAAGEGCAAAPVVTEAPQDTVPADTTPVDTVPQDTTPVDTVPGDAASAANAPSTTATASASAGQVAGALPVTGRGSLTVGVIGALLLSIGLGLLRGVRRRSV